MKTLRHLLLACAFIAAILPARAANDTASFSLASERAALGKTLASVLTLPQGVRLDTLANNSAYRTQLAFWKLGQNCDPAKLQAFFDDPAHKDFVAWLCAHPQALETYLANRPRVGKTRGTGQIQTWAAIWKNDPASRDGLWLRVALGQSLATEPSADAAAVDRSLARYQFTKRSYTEGKYFPDFEGLAPWEFRFVCNPGKPISEVEWCQNYLATKKPKFEQKNVGGSGYAIPYRLRNYKGVSIHKGGEYYNHKPVTFQLQTEYGGVCGAISTLSMWFGISKGLPAITVGQPGHCAMIWRVAPHQWHIGNNISGWPRSGMHGEYFEWDRQPSIIFLFDDFQKDPAAALRSCIALWSAQFMDEEKLNPPARVELAKAGINANFYNYDLWVELARSLQAKQASPNEWRQDAMALAQTLKDHPLILPGLLARYSPHFLKNANETEIAIWISTVANAIGSSERNRTGRGGPPTGFANFISSQMQQLGLPRAQMDQVSRGNVRGDFWKKIPADRQASIDALFRSAIQVGVKNPTLAGSITRSYYDASRGDPQIEQHVQRFFENLLFQARRNGESAGALTIARLLILGAADAFNADAVALNTFYSLQIQLESAPKNLGQWRSLTPVLLANASQSPLASVQTAGFLRQVGTETQKYPDNIRKHAATALAQLK